MRRGLFHMRITDGSEGSIPWVVVLLATTQASLSLAYALVMPAFQGPDETQHIDMVLVGGDLNQWPLVRERQVDPGIRAAKELMQFQRRNSPRSAADAPDREERASIQSLRSQTTFGSGAPNHISQHPPLYYAMAGAWAATLTTIAPVDLTNFDRMIFVLRAFGSLLGGMTLVIAWKAARVLGLGDQRSLLVASVPLLIPMYAYVHGSVSNDPLVIFFMSMATYYALRVWAGDLSVNLAVKLGAFVGLSILSKLFGLVLLAMVVVVFLSSNSEIRGSVRRFHRLCICLFVSFISGGWWVVRNLLVEGRIQPRGLLHESVDASRISQLGSFFAAIDVRSWQGFFGRFGFINTPLPRWILLWLSVLFVGCLLAHFFAVRSRYNIGAAAKVPYGGLAVAVLPSALLALSVWGRGVQAFILDGVIGGMQGRYLFGGIVGIALTVGVGLSLVLRRMDRSAWLVVWLVPFSILIAQGAGLYSILRHYWGASNGAIVASLEAFFAWSPWSGVWSLSFLAIVMGLTLWALCIFGRVARCPGNTCASTQY